MVIALSFGYPLKQEIDSVSGVDNPQFSKIEADVTAQKNIKSLLDETLAPFIEETDRLYPADIPTLLTACLAEYKKNKPLKDYLKNKRELSAYFIEKIAQRLAFEDNERRKKWIAQYTASLSEQTEKENKTFLQKAESIFHRSMRLWSALGKGLLSALCISLLIPPPAGFIVGGLIGFITFSVNLLMMATGSKTPEQLERENTGSRWDKFLYRINVIAATLMWSERGMKNFMSMMTMLGNKIPLVGELIIAAIVTGEVLYFYTKTLVNTISRRFSKQVQQTGHTAQTFARKINPLYHMLTLPLLDKSTVLTIPATIEESKKFILMRLLQQYKRMGYPRTEHQLQCLFRSMADELLPYYSEREAATGEKRPRKILIYNEVVELFSNYLLPQINDKEDTPEKRIEPEKFNTLFKKKPITQKDIKAYRRRTRIFSLLSAVIGAILPAIGMAALIPPPFGFVAAALCYVSFVMINYNFIYKQNLDELARKVERNAINENLELDNPNRALRYAINTSLVFYVCGEAASKYDVFQHVAVQVFSLPKIGMILLSTFVAVGALYSILDYTYGEIKKLFKQPEKIQETSPEKTTLPANVAQPTNLSLPLPVPEKPISSSPKSLMSLTVTPSPRRLRSHHSLSSLPPVPEKIPTHPQKTPTSKLRHYPSLSFLSQGSPKKPEKAVLHPRPKPIPL